MVDVDKYFNALIENIDKMSDEEFIELLEKSGLNKCPYEDENNLQLNNMFLEMSKEEIAYFFKECGLEVEEVEPGKGGFFLEGARIENPFATKGDD